MKVYLEGSVFLTSRDSPLLSPHVSTAQVKTAALSMQPTEVSFSHPFASL